MTTTDESVEVASHELDEVIWSQIPSISWDVEPPHTVTGIVLNQEVANQTDVKTKKVLTWEDGRPRKKVILTLDTEDGKRQMHVKMPSALFAAIREAISEAGLSGPVGSLLTVTYTGDGKAEKKGLNPPKEYAALLQASTESPS